MWVKEGGPLKPITRDYARLDTTARAKTKTLTGMGTKGIVYLILS
jgi:hypothetical protein